MKRKVNWWLVAASVIPGTATFAVQPDDWSFWRSLLAAYLPVISVGMILIAFDWGPPK